MVVCVELLIVVIWLRFDGCVLVTLVFVFIVCGLFCVRLFGHCLF